MKIITLAMILLLFHLMIPTASASIVINEVELDPPASELFSDAQQWIELYNSGGGDIDISGMVVHSIKNPSEEMDIEDGTVIGSKGFFVIIPSSWLDNKGNSLILKDENGTEIDRTPFLIDIDEDDCAWTRYPDGGPEWMFMVSSQGNPASGELCEEKEVLFTRFTAGECGPSVGLMKVPFTSHCRRQKMNKKTERSVTGNRISEISFVNNSINSAIMDRLSGMDKVLPMVMPLT